MTDNITRLVDTRFTVTDMATGPMMALHGVANGVGGALQRANSMINPLNMAITALGAGASIAGVVKLNSEFENTSQTLAGFLTAMGFASDFNSGLDLAASTMKSINTAAAALPGEAEDYIRVFKQGLPVLQRAVGGSLEDITKFSNRYTAVMSSLQVDSAQSARDMSLMLRSGVGGAGLDVRSWTSILPFIQQIKGQADISAQSFNRMTEAKRVELLNQAFDKLQPRIDAASTSWDAMSGAATSSIKLITREASTPLFDGMKQGLGEFNSLLQDSSGDLTHLGQGIVNVGQLATQGLVDRVKAIPEALSEANDYVQNMSHGARNAMGSWGGKLWSAGERLVDSTSFAVNQAGPQAGTQAGVVTAGAVMGSAFGPMGTAIGAVLGAFATHGEEVVSVMDSFVNIWVMVADAVGPLIGMTMTLAMLFGDLVAGVLPGLMDGIESIAGPILGFLSGMYTLTDVIFQQLRPSLMSLWTAVGALFSSIGDFLGPILVLFGRGLYAAYSIAAEYLVPVISTVIEWFGKLISGIAQLLTFLGKQIGKLNDAPAAAKDTSGGVFEAFMHLGDAFKKSTGKLGQDVKSSAPHAAGARGHGGKTVQDFRYSQFTMENKFDKDWDVDRIVTTLFDKVSAVGTRKLQSGFDPLYAF